MADDFSRRSVLKGVGTGIAATATASTAASAQASTMDAGEYLIGIDGRESVEAVTQMASRHERTIDLGSVRQVVHAEFPGRAMETLQAALEGEPVESGDACTATETTVESGTAAPEDGWTGEYHPGFDSCEITFELSAASPDADLDLYLTLDGRSASPDDHDREATTRAGGETITVDSVDTDATVGMHVASYSGSASFEVEIVETGGSATASFVEKLPVAYIERNETVRALAQTTPWGVDRVDADVAHSNGETGDGADIAIVDTGIDADHEDLQANLGEGKAFNQCSSGCDTPWDDDNGHGTHCAGIANGVDNGTGVVGVSTEATLHAVKVLSGSGRGDLSDVAEGIRHVADQGWDVASLSLGGSSSNSALEDACEYAYSEGVLLIAAAGNDGDCSDCVGYPAAYDECVAVSSTDEDDSLSWFSSTGPEIDLAAPGGAVYSTYPDGYNTLDGTSMACPHVSGAGGQLMANGYSNEEARDRLQATAEDIGLGSNEQGYGLLDVEAAVLAEGFFLGTDNATDVSETGATLNGTVSDLGDASTADVHFEWRKAGASSWNTTDTRTLSAPGSFSEDLTDLETGTEYEYRAVGETGDDSDTGTVQTFTPDDGSFCFITTATAREQSTLNSLRRFRDESMAATPVGRGLVGVYYRTSPPIARSLERHPESRTARTCRRFVRKCASLSDRQSETDSRAESAGLGVALTVLYTVGILAAVTGHVGITLSELLDR